MTISDPSFSASSPEDATLTGRAYRQIEELMVTLRLEPGQVLSESGLAQSLGIGRTPVREALQQLAREGLVTILPRRGVIVSEINVRNQLELLRVRREVERLMARLAADRATSEEASQFRAIASAMENSAHDNDELEFMRLDHQFNMLLASSCRNDYAQGAMSLMQGLSRRFWYMHYRLVFDLPRCARLHADLSAAIGEGKGEVAADALDRLIDYMESFTRDSL